MEKNILKTATKDISCWMLLKAVWDEHNIIHLYIPDSDSEIEDMGIIRGEKDLFGKIGILNTYKKESDAILVVNEVSWNAVVYKCIIPKGTQYTSDYIKVVGEKNISKYTIASSEKIRIVKFVEIFRKDLEI